MERLVRWYWNDFKIEKFRVRTLLIPNKAKKITSEQIEYTYLFMGVELIEI